MFENDFCLNIYASSVTREWHNERRRYFNYNLCTQKKVLRSKHRNNCSSRSSRLLMCQFIDEAITNYITNYYVRMRLWDVRGVRVDVPTENGNTLQNLMISVVVSVICRLNKMIRSIKRTVDTICVYLQY